MFDTENVKLNQASEPQHEIDLTEIFTGKKDTRYVNIASIPRSAYSYVDYCREESDVELKEASERIKLHNNLF